MSQNVFRLEGISKSYHTNRILSDLSLEAAAGCMLLLGANGSGKSTLLKICCGLLQPNSGQVFLNDKTISQSINQIGYLGHQLMLYENLSVHENLLLKMKLRRSNADLVSLLNEWNLAEFQNKTIRELSKGTQYRVALAATLLHDPSLILLDEPSSSLDESSLELLKNKIEKTCLQGGVAIIATHDITRLEPSAQRIVVLQAGKLGADSQVLTKKSSIEFYSQCNR